jgi:hypothetical protein
MNADRFQRTVDRIEAREERRESMGHNRPPGPPPTGLVSVEDLELETEALAKRAQELIVDADNRSEIVDDDTASRATLLLGMMKDCLADIEKVRVARKGPFLEAEKTVDQFFHTITSPLAGPNPKDRLGGSAGDLLARIDAWRKLKAAEAAAERRRLEAEAESQRRAAEAARQAQWAAEEKARREQEEAARKVEEAQRAAAAARTREEQANARAKEAEARREQEAAEAKARQEQADADLKIARANDEASRLAAQAAQAVARPIDSGYGPKITGRLAVVVAITNLQDAVRHCIDNNLEVPIRLAVQGIYERLARGKNGARKLPGATITEDTSTTLRRK